MLKLLFNNFLAPFPREVFINLHLNIIDLCLHDVRFVNIAI